MIKNERQYRITKAEAQKFEQALMQLQKEQREGSPLHPLIQKAQWDALLSQLEDLNADITEYERLKTGTADIRELDSLARMPHAIIKARIVSGLTQKELAQRLGLKEQQIQRYEASEYATASLSRLQQIAKLLKNELASGGRNCDVRELRERYRPREIRFLLIAESPPACEGKELRFFYNPDNEKYDFMFQNVMMAIFDEFKSEYRKGMKHDYLERFRQAGFFLIDAVDVPVNRMKGKERLEVISKSLKSKLAEIEAAISRDRPIFLITKNVFTVFHQRLLDEGYKVANDQPIPFPGQGHQIRFREAFLRCLLDSGYTAVNTQLRSVNIGN